MKKLVPLLALVAGCYGPNIPNGQQQCSSDNKCADGYTCGPNHLCYKNGQVPTGDMSMVGPRDMAGTVADLAMQPQPDLATAPDLVMPDLVPPPCVSDNDCASTPSTPRCDTGSGKCVACLAMNDNCPSGSYCDSSSFTCVQGCKGDSDCMGDAGTNACCNHVCVDTTSDPANCGGCAMACQNNTNTCCASKCVDTTSDPANCGGCGKGCSTNNIANPTCGASVCNGACNAGFSDCNNDKRTDGCEINSAVDVMNCGGCGVACSTNNITPACASGSCNPGVCKAGFADCNGNKQTDGCEINVTSDKNNCGGCGKVCSTSNMATVTCGGSVCNGTCANGFGDCNNNKQTDGCEVNLTNNGANCGACGRVCKNNNCASSLCTEDVGPTHTFQGIASVHYITQGACSTVGGSNDQADANYFCGHFYPSGACTTAVAFTKGSSTSSTEPQMHKNGGCTTIGTAITSPVRTCDLNTGDNTSNCKTNYTGSITSGLRNIVCRCTIALVGTLNGTPYYKVPVDGAMTDNNVRAACQSVGMTVPCAGQNGCMFNDTLCKITPETGCTNPMLDLSKAICGGQSPGACPALNGIYQYMGNLWSSGAACGVEGNSWCSTGTSFWGEYALCTP